MNRDNTYLLGNKFASGSNPNRITFKKGHIPWNKNKKGIHLSRKSEFKKGQPGINWVAVGTKTKRKDQNGVIRNWIKISDPNKWLEYSHYLWIRNGRKLKKGLCLHHVNNDSTDDRVENLILVSRSDHVKLHNRWNTKNKPFEVPHGIKLDQPTPP